MSEKAGYGSSFYKTVSSDLNDVFPDIKSFSPTNLKYIRYFYEMYSTIEIRQQAVDELVVNGNRQQLADDLGMQIIFMIPWGHHMFLLDKCKGNQDKALLRRRTVMWL